MVVEIAQEDVRRALDERRLQALEPADDLAEGPDGLAQVDHLPPQDVDLVEELAAGLVDERVLERIDPLAELLHDEEIVVDDRVDEGIGQEVRPELADAALGAADPLAHRAEAVPGRLLERQDEIGADDEAELVGPDIRHIRVALDHPQDDEDGVPQVLDLRPLGRRHDILEDERVDVELRAELADDRRVVNAVDVDPGHRGRVFEREAFLDGPDLLLQEVGLVVVDDRDPRLLGRLGPDVHQGPRRQTGLLRALDLIGGHGGLLSGVPSRIDRSGGKFQGPHPADDERTARRPPRVERPDALAGDGGDPAYLSLAPTAAQSMALKKAST